MPLHSYDLDQILAQIFDGLEDAYLLAEAHAAEHDTLRHGRGSSHMDWDFIVDAMEWEANYRNIAIMAASPDPDFFVKLGAFTNTTHRDVYPAIDPAQPELSQAGKVVGFAASFARANAKAIALLSRSADGPSKTEKLVKEINPATQVLSVVVDVTDAASPYHGIRHRDMVESAGTLITIKAFLSKTGASPSRPATIINLTSGSALATPPGMSSYSLSKLAVTKITAYLQAEHPAITSVSVDPGVVATDMAKSVPYMAPFMKDTPELSGGMAVWLSSGDKEFLSGKAVSVNWDVGELVAKKQEIVQGNLLDLCYRAVLGASSCGSWRYRR
ncbi:hypothetical protein BDW59DRAFT_156567 [Aspergillus cavernicola]|uniref:NAD(P)-binding protein n=1 Tax=Aspergillus cavernicola TaxID=176166 RepID=A0ABR4J193_9EURO